MKKSKYPILKQLYARRILGLFFFCLFIFFETTAIADSKDCLDNLAKRYLFPKGAILFYERYIISATMSMLGKRKLSDLAKGKIFLRPPFYIKLEQLYPSYELVVNDGKWVWWYIPSQKIAYKYPENKFSKEMSVLKDILNGMKHIREQFYLSFKEQKEAFVFQLTPRKKWQDISRVEVYADKHCSKIKEIRIYNLFGNITCFKIKKQKPSLLEPQVFQFSPPEGIKVIQER